MTAGGLKRKKLYCFKRQESLRKFTMFMEEYDRVYGKSVDSIPFYFFSRRGIKHLLWKQQKGGERKTVSKIIFSSRINV